MSNHCPDTKCEFWENYTQGFSGEICSYCSKKLVAGNPVHFEHKRKLSDSTKKDSFSGHVQDGDFGDEKRMKLSDSTNSILLPNRDETPDKTGQTESIPSGSIETSNQDEHSNETGQTESIPTGSIETSNQDEHSNETGQTESIPSGSIETSNQDEHSNETGQTESIPTGSIETPNQAGNSNQTGQTESIPTGSIETSNQDENSNETGQTESIPTSSVVSASYDLISSDEQDAQSDSSSSSTVSLKVVDKLEKKQSNKSPSQFQSTSKPEDNVQGNKRRREEGKADESTEQHLKTRKSKRIEGRQNLQSQQYLREPELYCEKEHDKSQYVNIQFNTLIFEEYWREIKDISIGIGNHYFDDVKTYITPFERTKTIQLQNGKFVIVSGTLKYPIGSISEDGIYFPYKYRIHSKDNKESYEHLHHFDKTNYNRNFLWNINIYPISQTTNRTYQQYDIMILPDIRKKEGWKYSDYFPSFFLRSGCSDSNIKFPDINDRRLISLQAFLPSYLGLGHSQPCRNLEDFITQFNTLIDTLMYFQIHNPDFNYVGNWESGDTNFLTTNLVGSWIMTTGTFERLADLDSKSVLIYFYLGCYLIQNYNLHNDQLDIQLMNLVDGSIESILKHKSYVFDDSVCNLDKFKNTILASVAEFIFNKVMRSREAEKLLTLIPIYHCISDTEEHSNRLHEDLKYSDKEYWGVPNGVSISLPRCVSFEFIKKALTLVKYDQLLIFTIVIYTLNDQNVTELCKYLIEDTQRYTLSALMSALLFRLDLNSIKDYNKTRTEVMKFLKTALTKESSTLELTDVARLTKLTLLLTTKLTIPYFDEEQFKLCLTIISQGLTYCDSHQPSNLSISFNKFKQFFDNFVIKWIREHMFKNELTYDVLLKEIKFWEEIITNYLFPPSIKWLNMVEDYLVKKFRDTDMVKQQYIINIFIHLHSKEKYHTLLQEIFLKELTSRLQMINSGDKNAFVKQLYDELSKTGQLEKVNNIFSKILIDEKSNFDQNSINHFLTWTSWDIYFSFLCFNNIDKFLSEDARYMLELASTQFVSLLEQIFSSQITGVNLDAINDNKEYFLTLAKNILESKQISEYSFDDILKNFDLCMSMYNWVREQRALLMHLHTFLENLHDINSDSISTFLSFNLEQMRISDVCYAEEDSYLFSPFLEVNSITTSPQFSPISNVCVSLPKSRILFQVFDMSVNDKEISVKATFDINNFYEKIWIPAWDSCFLLLKQLSNGTILISDLCKYFDCSESNDTVFDDLVSFDSCCKKYKNVSYKANALLKSCAMKINLYSKLQKCSDAANLIIKLKGELLITENFEIVENMRNVKHNFHNKQLKEVDEQVSGIASNLADFSKSNLDVIQAIIDRIDFIMWIKNNLKDLNELKTFVDISLTTCGGNPVDVDRITCLSSVCTNFAPIIFQIDENTNYETLIARCRQVIESVERNKELTKLLRQVGENVKFWEEMKKTHGSVEETTLMQLDSIMNSGIFLLKVGESLNLCDILSLSVDRENGEKRIYTLEQLREFRSKIMLVVSKTELPGLDTHASSYENSQIFTYKLDTITEIATIVIQLAETGNQRYLNYELFSDFKQQEDTLMESKMKLKATLEDWKLNVEEARNKHYFLNYYTISQIVFLQKGIKSFIEDREDREVEQLYHLLGLLNPDVSKQDIQQALAHSDIIPKQNPTLKASYETTHDFSKESLSTAISTQHSHISSTKSNYIPVPKSLFISNETDFPEHFSSVEKELAKKMSEEAGLSLTLVIKGIDEIQKNDRTVSDTNLLNWCFDHEVDSDTESMDVDQIVSQETEQLPVTESNAGTFHIEAAIDLHQLGYFLEEISRLYGNKIRAERQLPYNLKVGTPNLIVIPSEEVLEFVLSLYMSDNDKLPLPYYHEILICTPQTRLEEIEIFWRRAVMIPDKLNLYLFCLIGIENLSYHVAVQAVSKLKYLQQNSARNLETIGKTEFGYKLVLICSEEKEESSYMVAALDDCKIPILARSKSENVNEYLNERLSPIYRHAIFKSREPAWLVDRGRKRVRLVVSDSVGAGKSLYINNLKSDLLSQGIVSEEERDQSAVTVAIHGKQASEEHLAEQLLKRSVSGVKHGVMYHVDIASTVQLCLEPILFKLLILGGICKRSGELWHCRGRDYYVIEMTLCCGLKELSQFIRLFPNVQCVQPFNARETSDDLSAQTIDIEELRKEQYQRVCVYLRSLENELNLDDFEFNQSETSIYREDSLQILLKHCGIVHPSWAEMRNFVSFLDKQLSDCDNSDYCQSGIMGQDWKGFKSFVVKFMILMSRDFATPSLKERNEESSDSLTHFELITKRRWESNSHPYIFFNPDRHTMTFLGFHISNQGHLVDSDNPSHVIETNIMHPQLLQILTANGVNLQENFNQLNKIQKIMKIAGVMGIEWLADPDPGYVLTLDNIRKILAILMRFRCNIPVVIMGETGCGKTRLIQFMCSLQALQTAATNMLILKVHGGTTETDVMRKVEEAEKLAERNYLEYKIDTVLFFDEANTSPAIGLIKEIMCDRRMYGRHIRTDIGLQFIAACNPYRKHTEEMLNKLSSAGLGFFTKSSETTDRLGDIPLRELVYRVMELPASLRPLVWDFGQLSNSIEKTYTREIVAKHLRDRNSPIEALDDIVDVISDILASAQNYMRERKDECSFVSLRDVERAMRVMLWFYSKLKYFTPEQDSSSSESDVCSPVEREPNEICEDQGSHRRTSRILTSTINGIEPITYSLIISLAVCYRARLQERDEFDQRIIDLFRHPLTPIDDYQIIHREVDRCQQLLLDEMTVGANIAKNTALKENVFMMFVCIELKIPLFVIGKPGSSKSLAKSIISNSMQGSRCPDGNILQNFKQVQIMSYQCSQLSTADGIIGVFKSCRNLQLKTGSNKFTACVVLDEVGLAEDSPLLPLKVLHPLLEDSSYGSEEVESAEELNTHNTDQSIDTEDNTESDQLDEMRDHVAFIGISNWSLDPAKMNRGIMLSRGDPDIDELVSSAKGICQSIEGLVKGGIIKSIVKKIEHLAKAYLGLTNENIDIKRDYYGLRDFYSLVKMLVFFCDKYDTNLNRVILEHAVRRNFGGLSDIDPVEKFQDIVKLPRKTSKKGPISSPLGLIRANLVNLSRSFHGETRYLLLLTENYAALNILLRSPDMWPKQQDIQSIRVIFGSSFPSDQEYSAVCRNINRIKVCMESGKTVILLNLENLYESLYDALNQYYMEMNNQRYVDLGLGTHRMKCRVHNEFKLIVVTDKDTVRERFPTPLINRLEKHILTMSTVLTRKGVKISKQLAEWAKNFSTLDKTQSIGSQKRDDFTEGDCFIGSHRDTPSSIVFHVMKEMYPDSTAASNEVDLIAVLERSQKVLLRMATTDAVLRVKNSFLSIQSEQIITEYFKLQLGSLEEYLSQVLSGICGNETGAHLTLATTHSRLLTERDIDQLQQRLCTYIDSVQIRSLSLQQFQTEQQYTGEIQKFLRGDSESDTRGNTHKKILLVQCERGAENAKLIACARHKTVDELKDWREEQRGEFKCEVFLLFLVQLSREAHGSKFMSFCGGDWNTVHIDDIRCLDYTEMPPISQLVGKQIYQIFGEHVVVS